MTPLPAHESLAESDAAAFAAALLDCLDRHPGDVAALVDDVPPGAIADPIHGPIVDAIRAAVAAGVTPTIGDVAARLREAGHDNGSPVRIALADALRDYVNTGRRAIDTARGAAERLKRYHAESVVRDAAERYAGSPDPAALAELREAIAALEAGSAVARPLPTALDAIDRWSRHEKTPTVATGFSWFDGSTDGGLPVGGIVALVAPPGAGKSALALQLTAGAMLADADLRAVWSAGEMSLAGIGRRLVTVSSGFVDGAEPVTMAEAGRGAPRARAAAKLVAEAIGDRLAFVEPPLTVAAIDAAAARTAARLVVVDYLQLVAVPDGGRDRVADLDRTVGQFRDMAIRRECAVIVVSSIAKATNAAAHAGQLGRGTAEIGFAAELVYAAEREETPDGRPMVGPDGAVAVTWRCAKARNAELRDLVTTFDGAAQTFHPAGDTAGFDPPTAPAGRLGTASFDAWTPPEAST